MIDKTNKLSGVTDINMAALIMAGVMEHEFCSDAFTFAYGMLSDKEFPDRIRSILVCDGANIRGVNLIKFIDYACCSDIDYFIKAVDLVENEIISLDDVHKNLALERPIEFIDSNYLLNYKDSIKRYSKDKEAWQKYASKQKDSFLRRLNDCKSKQYQKKKDNE